MALQDVMRVDNGRVIRGGGTSDYTDLTNKPSINNVELSGNKTTSDLGINADNVMMSDGVTSVEDRLDAHTFGTAVDISSYTSSNKYTCPSDGYLRIDIPGTVGWIVYAVGDENFEIGAAATTVAHSYIYVRKGMQVWKLRQSSSGTYEAKFYPLQ